MTVDEFESNYLATVRLNERILSMNPSPLMRGVCRRLLFNAFQKKMDHDYQPFTGTITWHSTGLINMHGRWRYRDFTQMCRDMHHPKKRLPVDPELYTFEMLQYAYRMKDITLEEYLENTRRVAKYIREDTP